MKIMRCLQVCFIYIGAIIGAGFATGREIMLYFGGSGMLSGIVAGVLMGALCGAFLLAAKSFKRLTGSDRKALRAIGISIKCVLWVCTLASFVCMVSGCEEIIEGSFSISNVGLWTGVFVSFLGICEMSVTRKLNTIIVPMIMVLLAVLSAQGDIAPIGGFDSGKVFGYCGMNIMMGGYIIAEQEEEYSLKETVFISVLCAFVFALSIALVYGISIDFKDASMPIWEFAKKHGMSSLSGIVIYLAIFSTLIGCTKLICQENSSVKIPRIFSVAMLIIFALLALKFDFATVVGYCYPIIGVVGIAYTVFMLSLPFIYAFVDIKKSKSNTYKIKQKVKAK